MWRRPVLLTDVVERRNLVQIDNGLRLGQPQLHQRHQTLAAGQEFCLLSMLLEERQHLGHISRRKIVLNGFGIHPVPLSLLPSKPEWKSSERGHSLDWETPRLGLCSNKSRAFSVQPPAHEGGARLEMWARYLWRRGCGQQEGRTRDA